MVLPDKSSGKTVQGNTNGFATFDSDTDSALAKSLLQSKGTDYIPFNATPVLPSLLTLRTTPRHS